MLTAKCLNHLNSFDWFLKACSGSKSKECYIYACGNTDQTFCPSWDSLNNVFLLTLLTTNRFHIRQAPSARRQVEMFLTQMKNVSASRQAYFACCMLASQFCPVDLALDWPLVKLINKMTNLQILMSDKQQCWSVSSGR